MKPLTNQAAEKVTLNLLHQKFGVDQLPMLCIGGEDSNHVIPMLEYLLPLHNSYVQLWLWNNARWATLKDYQKCGASKPLLNFLRKRERQSHRYNTSLLGLIHCNPNRPIPTDRLILRAPDEQGHDLALYQQHLLEDGDFLLYASKQPSPEAVHELRIDRPFSFTVFAKDDGRMVGYCGFYQDPYIPCSNQSWSRVGLEYYIFKNERKQGYGKEMMLGLIHQAFSKGLWAYINSPFDDCLSKVRFPILSIRAGIKTSNPASLGLIRSLGFISEGVLHQVRPVEGKKKYLDEAVFFLQNPYFK